MKKKLVYALSGSEMKWMRTLLLTGFMIMMSVLTVVGSATSTSLNLQQKRVTGKVTDATTGEALPGVTVVIKGTTSGVASDLDGSYTLDVPSGSAVLQFTSVGYASQEVTVGPRDVINVAMQSDVTLIEELVVIGYGFKKKRDLTGSISSISASNIEDTPVKDVLSALQGRAPGVVVTANSGAPGAGITVRVRGYSSLNSGNDPLYVIDGVPVESNAMTSLNGYDMHGLNPLSDINPGDIESIEVLKDAASTAIYGSRAANGVVLITTKRGREGQAKVTLNYFSGISEITRHLGVLNAQQWREIIIDSYANLDRYNNATTPTEPHWTAIDSLNPMNNGDVDWQSVMYRKAWQHQVDLGVQGGSDAAKYAFSTSYLDQDGIFLASNYKRITSRLNTDFKVSDKVTIGQNVSFTNGKNNRINAGGTGNLSLVQSILVRPPIYSLTYPDGSPIYYFNGKRNPVGMAEECTHLNVTNRIIANQYLEYNILDNLMFRTSVSIDFISMKEDEFYPTTVDYRAGYNWGAVRARTNMTWANENYLTYNTTIGEGHDVAAMAGFSMQDWKMETTGLDGLYFASDNIRTLNGAGTISNQAVNKTDEHSMLSYFGRISYNYKGRYLAEANIRADGSSRFGADNRFGYFPSASAAWRFSDESFAAGLNFLTDGKLRISVGQTGNEAIPNYVQGGEFAIGTNYLTLSGASPTVMPNQALKWEVTTQYNLGLDLAMFNNRVSFVADFYIKNTSDLLFAVPIPETTGFGYITRNIGDISNKGMEFAINTHNINREFQWSSSFNIGFNRNSVVDLPDEVLTNGYIKNGDYHILKEGEPIGTFYGWKFLGVYARDEDNVNGVKFGSATGKPFIGGDPIWDDVNDDNVINDEDKQIIGDAQPIFAGGFSNDFSYKNFSLNVFLQFCYGNDIYSHLNNMRNWVFAYNNVSTDALTRWRQQGDVTDYPAPVRNDPKRNEYLRVSDRWIEDGSYMRLKNVTFSYTIPKAITSRAGISRLRAYVSGENLLTFTHYTGYDPEVNSYSGLQVGVDEGSYPQSRTVVFGLNLEF
ncbi:MAG: SusC/RagA family TonB-linked outer membrane protein [Bacteroidales bacterium]